ncbi:MAG: AMP-binding protein [Hahellaceae bacterium]|nr:AMP-binding protein [Hahellaceae bacterium]
MLTIPENLKSFLEPYLYRMEHQPDDLAYIFLEDGEQREVRITFRQLHDQAQNIAKAMRQHAELGDRVVLIYQPGIEFIFAFAACLFAGVIAVPVYPPQGPKDWPRFLKIVQDADVKLICTSSIVFKPFQAAQKATPQISAIPCIATDQLSEQTERWVRPPGNKDDIVFLQYTSGSTGDPKGVMVTHGNLLHNQHINVTGYQHDENLVVVSWLPQYHDMGLIGNILLAPYTGRPVILMSPMAFLQKPLRWLQAISRYRATASGAPNFAYELCLRKIKDEDLAELDLSHWDFAYNGAEFIRTSTIERFYERFKDCGLKKEAICPIYGLAESTLIVTAADKHSLYKSLYIDSESLHRGKIDLLTGQCGKSEAGEDKGRWVTGCGTPFLQDVRVVNPETLRPCNDLTVGEIWVRGESICKGYWGKPETTTDVFGAHTSDTQDGPYLRTGDLGFLHEGELYITGRHKEVIILDGRNLYPQDIEDVVQQDRPQLRKGCGAAFAVDDNDVEKLVLVQEVARGVDLSEPEFDKIAKSIRSDVVEVFGVNLFALVLIKQGTFLKTSSGKIRRRAMREKFLQKKLQEIYRSVTDTIASAGTVSVSAKAKSKTADSVPAVAENATLSTIARSGIEKIIVSLVAPHVGLHEREIDISRPLSDYGMDSKTLVGLSGELNDALTLDLAPRIFYDYPSIEALARYLSGESLVVNAASGETEVVDLAEPVAIIGMACRFPGGADSLAGFWQLLAGETDAISDVPDDRWNVKDYYDPAAATEGKMNTRWGGFLSQVADFDADFFNISPREARSMDPQQRLLLETSWEALEHANIPPSAIAGSNAGVFIGISNNDYDRIRARTLHPNDAYAGTGNAFSIAANRLSYFFDLHGPSLAIDTACSSSLVAIHQACQSLRMGESQLAFAAGVNLILTPDLTVTFSQSRMMAADGRCKTFDDSADGYVRGEGCGVVLLKRLSDAERDGDRVLAVVKGSGVTQDGRSNGLTAPNGPSQERAIRQALQRAQVLPQQVSYVEAHGTGTSLGDPIEVQALQNVYGPGRTADSPLWIGSVKTNIGHLEAAAGIAGVIKTVLSMQQQLIPAHKHFKTPNRLIAWEKMQLTVPVAPQSWTAETGKKRLAGVSSFGFGGTNAHVLIEDYPALAAQKARPAMTRLPALLCLSARNRAALRALTQRHIDNISASTDVDLHSYCRQVNAGRDHFSQRLTVRASSLRELRQLLTGIDWLAPAEGVFLSQRTKQVGQPKQAWLFTGQGSQYERVAETLYQSQPVFREVFDQCDELLTPLLGESMRQVLYSESAVVRQKIHQTSHTQPLLFCLEYALAKLWMSWGIKPDMMLGHSVGEYAAACLAGVFSLEDAIKLIEARGRLIQALEKPGSMVAVFAHLDDVHSAMGDLRNVSVAAFNGPGQIVIAGDEAELAQVVTALTARKIESRALQVSHGFHSPLMSPMVAQFKSVAESIRYQLPDIDIISTVTGRQINDEIASSAYWCSHILAPVMFEQGIDALREQQADVFLEIGPSTTLAAMGRRCDPSSQAAWVSTLRENTDDNLHIATTMAQLYVAGVRFDWQKVNEGAATFVTLPSYPFQRQKFWLDVSANERSLVPVRQAQNDTTTGAHFLLGKQLFSPRLQPGEMHFDTTLTAESPHFTPEFGADELTIRLPVFLVIALQIGAKAYGRVSLSTQDLELYEDVSVAPNEARTMQTFVETLATNEVRFKCYSPLPESDSAGIARQGDEETPDWKLVASATIIKTDKQRRPAMNMLNTLQTRISRDIDAQEYYENCRDRGLFYGAFPQLLVSHLFTADNEALGRISLNKDEAHWSPQTDFPLHYIHACFQVIGAICYEDSDHTFLPYRISRVEFFDAPPTNGWVHVIRNSSWDDEERHLDVDVLWLNDAGQPVVSATGMKLKAARTPVKGLKDQLRTMTQSRRLRTLREFLLRIVGKALSIETDRLDQDRSLMELGMDSLIAMEILGRVRYALEIELNIVKLQDGVSIASLASLLESKVAAMFGEEDDEGYLADDVISPLVIIQKGEPGRIPLILVHPIGGSVFCYGELANQIGDGQPVYALQAHAFIDEDSAPDSIEEMASDYLEEIKRVQPHGPYLLGGWSLGGVIALELAHRLETQGERVELLALIDSAPVFNRRLDSERERDIFLLNLMSLDMGISGAMLTDLMEESLADSASEISTEESLQALFKEAQKRGIVPKLMPFYELSHRFNVMKLLLNVLVRYEVPRYLGSASVFKAESPLQEYNGMNANLDWDKYITHIEQVQTLAGNHFTLLDSANVATLASYLRKSIRSKVTPHNRFFLSEPSASVYSEANQVLKRIELDAQVKEVKGRLKLDESHPFFFDHPLDHVPGALVIEAIWQMLDCITAEQDPDNAELYRYVQRISITFRRWIEKELPTPLSLLLMDGGPDSLEFAGIVTQLGYIACELDLSLKYQQATEVKPLAAKSRQKAPRELLHKSNPHNVLISAIRQGSHQEFVCDLIPPSLGHVFYNGSVSDAGVRKSVPPMYLLEAARQITTHLGHSHYGVPMGSPMNLVAVDMQIQRPLALYEALELAHTPIIPEGAVLKDIARFEIEIRSAGQAVGHIGITAQAVDKETYLKQRGLDT